MGQVLTSRRDTGATPATVTLHSDPGWSAAGDDLRLIVGVQGAPDASTVHVHLLDHHDESVLEDIDRRHHALGESWVPVFPQAGRVLIGPLCIPGRTARYLDVLDRQRAVQSGRETEMIDASLRSVDGAASLGRVERRWVLAILASELRRLLQGDGIILKGRELELDLLTLTAMPHPVLPLPDRFPNTYDVTHHSADLVDSRSGIVSSVGQFPLTEHPRFGVQARARLSDLSSRFDGWIDDRQGFGMSLRVADEVSNAAVSEVIEAYCGAYVGQVPLFGRDGARVAVPTTDSQVAAVSLLTGSESLVDARDVFLNWRRLTKDVHRPGSTTNIAGIAVGPTLDFALVSALEEAVERDAFTVWWHNAPTLPRSPLPAGIAWDIGLSTTERRDWPFLIGIPNEYGIPVVCAVLINRSEQLVSLGFAARRNAMEATRKALAEAYTLQDTSRGLLDRHSALWSAIDAGTVERGAIKSWRADRRYRLSYRQSHLSVTDLLAQLQYNLDPAAQAEYLPMLEGPVTDSVERMPGLPERTPACYVERLAAAGLNPHYVDITTPDVAVCGLRAVRVIVPGLIGNAPAAYPPLASHRVRSMGVTLGWRTTLLSREDFNTRPMPYA